MSQVSTWASAVGFKNVGEEVYRGSIHSSHLESVQKALTDMGLTMAGQKANFEIWSSEDDKEVVLINHSGGNQELVTGTQVLKTKLEGLQEQGYKLFMSTAHVEAMYYPDALDASTAAALAADGFTIYADKPQSMMRIKRGRERAEDLSWTFTIASMEGR